MAATAMFYSGIGPMYSCPVTYGNKMNARSINKARKKTRRAKAKKR